MSASEKKASLSSIYLVVFLDVLGFGVIIPVIRDLTQILADASSLTLGYAALSGILMSSYSFAQFIFAPLWGKLSDRYGRKQILFISVFGNVLSYLMWAVSQSYEFFLISRLVSGLTGGNISVAQSYIADVTSKEDRAKAMGMFGAIFGIGFVIGPFLGGYLSTTDMTKYNHIFDIINFNQFSLIGIFCAGLSLLNLGMIVFNLKESRSNLAKKKNDQNQSHLSLWGFSFKNIPASIFHLIMVNFLFAITFVHLESILAWDLLNKFNQDAENTGYFFACMGLLLVFVQGGLYRRIQGRFPLSSLIKFSLILSTVSLIAYPFMNSMIIFSLVLAMFTVGLGIINPSISAMVSLESDPDHQGFHLGVMQSFSSLARAIIPAAATFMYDYISPSIPALAAAFFAFAAWGLMLKNKK